MQIIYVIKPKSPSKVKPNHFEGSRGQTPCVLKKRRHELPLEFITKIIVQLKRKGPTRTTRGNYSVQVHLSFIQHTRSQILCIKYISILNRLDIIISFHNIIQLSKEGKWVGMGICQLVFRNHTMIILLAWHIQPDKLK